MGLFSSKRVLEFVIKGRDSSKPVWKDLSGRLKGLVTDKKALIGAAVAVGVAIVGMAVKMNRAYQMAITKAGAFQKATLQIVTLLGAQNVDVAELSKGLQDLAVKYGQLDTVMAQARYNVVSAGFTDMADSMEILDVASKSAIAGVTDVNTAVTVITQTLNAYKLGAEDAKYVAGQLFATVKGGVTTFPELAANLGKVTGVAYTAGISLDQVSAAMAVLTKNGANTAEAATALNALILAIGAASGESKDKLDAMGISLKDGLGPALAAVAVASEGSLEKLAELIPNVRAIRAAASASAGGAKDFVRQLEAMTNGVSDFNEAYNIMAASYDQAVKRNEAATNRLNVAWGNTGIPGKTAALNGFADSADHLARAMEDSGGPLATFNRHMGELAGNMARVTAYQIAPDGALFGVSWSDLWPGAKKLNEELAVMPANARAAMAVLQEIEAGTAGGVGFPSPLGDPTSAADTAAEELRARFEKEAEDLGVNLFTTAFDPTTGRWVEVEKSIKELAAELTAQLNENLETEMRDAPALRRDNSAADYEGVQDPQGVVLLEDIMALEAEQETQRAINHEAEADRLMVQAEMLRGAAEQADAHIAQLQATEEANESLRNGAISIAANFERLASNSLSAMFQATNGAIMFGRVLRTVVMDALSAVIVKMLMIKALSIFLPGLSGAGGGGAPAAGSADFIGPVENIGLYSTGAAALGALATASAVSPFDLPQSGGGGGVNVALNVSRPVGYLDVIDMGAAVVETARYVSEANL